MVGDPDRRFTRDPVRMLRVIRHAARTGFTIEPATLEGCAATATNSPSARRHASATKSS